MAGWALAGVEVRAADSDAEVRQAVEHLPADLTLLLVTEHVADAMDDGAVPAGTLLAVLPP
jgi:vacuolar-type H+-ATPase subunit F/Vma7